MPYYLGIIYIQGVPQKALQFLSIRAQSRCDPDPDHISIGPGLTETVTLFLGHPVYGSHCPAGLDKIQTCSSKFG